ncbi:MAG: aspartate kinase [Bacteroidales bacterium]
MEVFKFGGASVNSAEAIKNVALIVSKEPTTKILLVFSAMGKTTNALENLLEAYYSHLPHKDSDFKTVLSLHLEIVSKLFLNTSHPVYTDLKQLFSNLNLDLQNVAKLNKNCAYDQIVSYGERLSTLIIGHYLQMCGIENKVVDARELLYTDTTYRDAKLDWVETKKRIQAKVLPLMEQCNIVISQGFIAGSQEHTTTLGREGSDYSAAIFAYCLSADKMTIWKDVPGVLNADPKFFSPTIKMDYISYTDATELAYYGASIIHPKTIKPLQNKGIPLHVRSFLHPEEEGSWIGLEGVEYTSIPSYIFKINQMLISIYPKDFSFITEENLSFLFSCFVKYGVKVNVMQNSALSFSVCVDTQKGEWQNLLTQLQEEYKVAYNEDLILITIRHYTQEVIDQVLGSKTILLEQRSRNTIQLVVSK